MYINRNMGLKKKTVLITLLFFVASVLVSSVTFYSIYARMRKETIQKSMDSMAVQKKAEVEDYFNNLKTLAYSTGFSSWMQMLFQKNGIDPKYEYEIAEGVEYFLRSISELNSGVKFAAIMNNGIRLRGIEDLDYNINPDSQAWYPEFIENGKYIEEGEGKGIYTRGSGWYLNLFYPINDKYTLKQEGILVMTLLPKHLLPFTNTGVKGEYIILSNDQGKKLASSVPAEVSETLKIRPSRYMCRSVAVDIGGKIWTMDLVFDQDTMVVENQNIWVAFVIVLLLAALLSVAAAVVCSRYLTIPILECRDSMKQIRNNQMGIQIHNRYHDEIGELVDGFNEMSRSIHTLIEKNQMISMLQKETEYQMLLQQINPHFLYNTLEMINGLILTHNDQEAVTVCETLGQIFHYNLKQDKWITVREEMDYIKEYLLIMTYKIKDLAICYEIDPQSLDRKILKAVLQPLVENCIKHGFAEKTKDCCISILIENAGEGTAITIMDNGKGMTKTDYARLIKELQEIRENPNHRKETSVHIGVWNVFHRLYLEYEETMEFQIVSREMAGTRIQIHLPGGKQDVTGMHCG